VARVVDSKRIWTKVAEVWGRPMVYSIKPGQKPLLGAIAPKGWLAHVTGGTIDSNASASFARTPELLRAARLLGGGVVSSNADSSRKLRRYA
jgi:hypothetical protein